jgi:uncharacterized membrane protein HdeD (DUF308 family)
MSEHAAPHVERSQTAGAFSERLREITGYWWVWLVTGIAWLIVALVILQFDRASVTTVGILIGFMFLFAAGQNFVLSAVADSARWLWALFGVLFVAAAVVSFVNPENTFAGLADILGFLFLMVGIWWMVRAFLERPLNPLWWLGLIAGVLMTAMAFWTAGQFFIEKAYILLVFAGIWAIVEGIGDIARAFAVRELRKEI